MSQISKQEIEEIVRISGLQHYTGTYAELGGGEINDTFLLDCETEPVILRIAKHTDQNTLKREAHALSLLTTPHVPKLIFFDENKKLLDRYWILETYTQGRAVPRLSTEQFKSLGTLLAKVHTTKDGTYGVRVWEKLLWACQMFGDEQALLSHKNDQLRSLIRTAREVFNDKQHTFNDLPMSLIHGDATPSNILVQDDQVALIDWELSQFNDAMAEFSTVYYEDIDYNQGKWRIKITLEEKSALFQGYEQAGGTIDEDRIRFWINFDKLGAAIFLYWRIHDSGREANDTQLAQYQIDLDHLILSLEQNL
jgi:aminoglycoside phosphotransferase (APT) family kinase protein